MSSLFIGQSAKAKQRAALLSALHRGPVSTLLARDELGIAHPAGRIMELRKLGHDIETRSATAFDGAGRPHRVALYCLANEQGEAAE